MRERVSKKHRTSTWNYYINVIFDGVIEADFREKVGQILCWETKKTQECFSFTVLNGLAGRINDIDYDFVIGEPYIKCKKVFLAK